MNKSREISYKMKNFNKGEKVVRKGTLFPVMQIKGHTLHGGNPYNVDKNKYTCFWLDNGEPYWEEFDDDELEIYSTNTEA